jgi:APA family basic amino acid/polyamine antiporter
MDAGAASGAGGLGIRLADRTAVATLRPRMTEEKRSRQTVSWPAAAALVAGNMIGTGVFTSLGFQLVDVPGGFGIALLWLLGGVIAFCGALSYAELGAAMPRSGGEYHLLGRTWHPLAGFLSGWVSATVGFAAPVALACTAFGTYVSGAFFGGDGGARMTGALAVLAAVTVVHVFTTRMSARFQLAATLLKLAALLVLIAAGWLAAATPGVSFRPGPGDAGLVMQPGFIVALFFVAYSYSGWNAAVYIAGDLANPGRDLPRALLVGTGVVTAVYVLFNTALLRSTPAAELRGQVDVALVGARHLFGESGGKTMGALISVGLVSTISAMMWAGPRVAATMGQDWRVLAPLARTNRSGVPIVAVLWQAAIAAVFIVAGGFQAVLTYIEFTLALSTFLTVAGVFWLRWREPGLARPFRAWGYPVAPALFLLMTGYALVRFATDPRQAAQSFYGLLTVGVGAVLFLISPRTRAGAGDDPR